MLASDDSRCRGQTLTLFRPLGTEEEALLADLLAWARSAAMRPDAKAQQLFAWLERELRPAGRWNDQRVIIFTEYRSTQKWLQGLLASHGFGGDHLMVMYGGMDSDDRERIKAAFQAEPSRAPVRILLATDAASEGIDLQNYCSRLIHLEIPWNPNRMEQRNGRIDRHGQRADKVLIHHFAPAGFKTAAAGAMQRPPGDLEGDIEFLMRAVRKVEAIREDLGKVGPVIASQVSDAMLGRRPHAQLNTENAERDAEAARKLLRVDRNLREQLARLYEQLQDTRRTLHLEPQSVLDVVRVGLELAGQPALIPATLPSVWPDPTLQRTECPVFHIPHLTGVWRAATDGLADPHSQEIRPVAFDHALVAGRHDVVLLHLNHRLVQMCLQLLRGEVWSRGTHRKLNRATARTLPDSMSSNPVVVAHARLVVLGGDNQRLHEELIFAGGELKEGRFTRIDRVGRLQELVDAGLPHAVPAAVQDRIKAQWEQHRENLQRALDARMKERTETLQSRLDDRAAKEVAAMRTALGDLMTSIRAQLIEVTPQLELWTTPEREQFDRDRGSLEHRLSELPAEIEREAQLITARYAKPQARLFPVAVTYLVPEHLARA